jgi:hypothetical protein
MKHKQRYLSSFIASILAATSALASPVWHCSRSAYNDPNFASTPAKDEQFSIASFNSSADVIGVSVRDLIDIYTGTPVRIGGLSLSACFLMGHEMLTTNALTSLGINLNSIQALARKNNIVNNNLYYVNNETQMVACIAQNFPAVGYLSKPNDTEKIQPCF